MRAGRFHSVRFPLSKQAGCTHHVTLLKRPGGDVDAGAGRGQPGGPGVSSGECRADVEVQPVLGDRLGEHLVLEFTLPDQLGEHRERD
jgi:hypothetical protein